MGQGPGSGVRTRLVQAWPCRTGGLCSPRTWVVGPEQVGFIYAGESGHAAFVGTSGSAQGVLRAGLPPPPGGTPCWGPRPGLSGTSSRQSFGRAVRAALYAPHEPMLDYNMVVIFITAVGTVALGGYWAGARDVKK